MICRFKNVLLWAVPPFATAGGAAATPAGQAPPLQERRPPGCAAWTSEQPEPARRSIHDHGVRQKDRFFTLFGLKAFPTFTAQAACKRKPSRAQRNNNCHGH